MGWVWVFGYFFRVDVIVVIILIEMFSRNFMKQFPIRKYADISARSI